MSFSISSGISVSELVERFGGELRRGDRRTKVTRLASLGSAVAGDLSFLAGPRHRHQALTTAASVVLVSDALLEAIPETCTAIVVSDPYAHFARIARWAEAQARPGKASQIHPSASISPTASIGKGVSIGPFSVIEDEATIDANTSIGANCFIGNRARIGADCTLYPSVTLLEGSVLGARCIVHSGTVIGSDGFGFAREQGRWEKIPQLGTVQIGDDVEIGANCTIDRGALDATQIGNGCKLDNLIQIAHNVCIGADTAIAGCVGIAGSAVIGQRCMIGGGAGILGHLEICDDVVISAMSLVTRSIATPGFYTGVFPLMPNHGWERAAATLRQLPRLRDKIRGLERSINAMRKGQSKREE